MDLPRKRTGTTAPALLLLAAVLLGGCGSSADGSHGSHESHGSHSPSPEAATQSAPVVQGGAPGESGTTISPSDAPGADGWSRTDADFVTMMIPHHAQALEMTRLAREHSSNPGVLSLAKRIKAAQGPEIVSMSKWLDARDLRVPRASDPAQTMAGMLTEAQMTALGKGRGKEFDRLFLTGMIQHHQGAITMADPMAASGSDAVAIEMATDIETTQKVEIEMMEKLLAKL
ncbi:uncharacterized protein (DUF305 family) [Nocardioides albertanoniae]|uniref:Uncharacterized protein (DUF305 family) n=1 Tax=Nocardioides albertanoniae TaxID=1175486 RepID=A0A543ACD8_9ACTN|nr:DUF305 domain-containing protein [Nocardioides albertanoniae]TQL70237.1 uncharacterized protein (DUF305 family) [Nocardioides albertanoniae]